MAGSPCVSEARWPAEKRNTHPAGCRASRRKSPPDSTPENPSSIATITQKSAFPPGQGGRDPVEIIEVSSAHVDSAHRANFDAA